MGSRLASFAVWAVVAASAVFWALRMFAAAPAAPAHTVAVSATATPRGDLARLFGAEAPSPADPGAVAVAAPELASRFKLVGLAATRTSGSREGLALLSVDGKPARPFRVGQSVADSLVLLSVQGREVQLGAAGGDAQLKIELPPLPPPTTGTLPPPGAAPLTLPRPGLVVPPGLATPPRSQTIPPTIAPATAPVAPAVAPQPAAAPTAAPSAAPILVPPPPSSAAQPLAPAPPGGTGVRPPNEGTQTQ